MILKNVGQHYLFVGVRIPSLVLMPVLSSASQRMYRVLFSLHRQHRKKSKDLSAGRPLDPLFRGVATTKPLLYESLEGRRLIKFECDQITTLEGAL